MPKKHTKTPSQNSSTSSTTTPRYPYTTTPNSLRRFLKLVPNKPRPNRINNDLLKAWDIRDTNANTIIRVLKAIDFATDSNEPTDAYTAFMQPTVGPTRLGEIIRNLYLPFFEASHEPFKESDEFVRRLFNIHSGGSEATLNFQIQTFKVLCEFASFSSGAQQPAHTGNLQLPSGHPANENGTMGNNSKVPTVHIDLHIHLPENKSTRDYQAIIEDIAKYIYRYDGSTDE